MKYTSTKRKVNWRSNNAGKKYASINLAADMVLGDEVVISKLDETTLIVSFV